MVHIDVSGPDGEHIAGWTTTEEGKHIPDKNIGGVPIDPIGPLTFDQVHQVNLARCERWHPGFPADNAWTGGDWGNAFGGEVGEAVEAFLFLVAATGRAENLVKKLRRSEEDMVGVLDLPPDGLRENLGEELADVFLYMDLLATKYGIDLAGAIVKKFNKVSELQGFPERL